MEKRPEKVQEAKADVTKTADASAAQTAPQKTTGEKIHKWTTYLGIDWFFNTAVGVSFSYAAKYTDIGKKYWSGPITKTFDTLLKPVIQNPEKRMKSAGYGNIFMSIIAGGMLTIPPLMVLENNKVRKSFAKFYDGIIYGKDKVENDPQFQQAYDNIGTEPKKDFGSGMKSRFAALAPLLALVLIPSTKKVADKALFNHVERGSEALATKLGYTAETAFKSLPMAERKERLKYINESAAMDFGLCLPYALMHKFWYDQFASKKHAELAEAGQKSHAEQVGKALQPASHAEREEIRQQQAEHSQHVIS